MLRSKTLLLAVVASRPTFNRPNSDGMGPEKKLSPAKSPPDLRSLPVSYKGMRGEVTVHSLQPAAVEPYKFPSSEGRDPLKEAPESTKSLSSTENRPSS